MIKTKEKEWDKRVSGALAILEKTAMKRLFDCTHTVDRKKLRKGLKVFVLGEPNVQWTISEIENRMTIKQGTITLSNEGMESIKRHPSKLFVSQDKAISASIQEINQTRMVILRTMKENLDRLDAVNRVKELRKLRNKKSKRKV